jgi:hypothetical protein
MGPGSIMPAADVRDLLSLAAAKTSMDASSGGDGAVALTLQADQLDAVRAQMRDGETISVSA